MNDSTIATETKAVVGRVPRLAPGRACVKGQHELSGEAIKLTAEDRDTSAIQREVKERSRQREVQVQGHGWTKASGVGVSF